MSELIKCSKCGKEIDDSASVCPFCGEEFDNEVSFTYVPEEDSRKASKGFWAALIAVLAAFFVILPVLLFIFIGPFRPVEVNPDDDGYVKKSEMRTEVPNFMGNTEQRADEKAERAGLVLDIEYESNDRYDNGTVFEQDVEEMTIVNRGTHIKLKLAVIPKHK